jgi:ABC-type nitrate/sulfonate/bicarbonate transport system substrate-binding protein
VFLLFHPLFLLLLTLLLPSRIYAAEAPIKLRVAYPTLTSSYAVAWIAKEENIFKKHGLDVELLFIQSSPILVAAPIGRRALRSEIK